MVALAKLIQASKLVSRRKLGEDTISVSHSQSYIQCLHVYNQKCSYLFITCEQPSGI